MARDWRKKKRRRLRSAPEERPILGIGASFRARVEGIVGPHLAPMVLGAFEHDSLPGTPKEFQRIEERLLDIARSELVGPLLVELVREVHRHEEFVVWSMADARLRGARLRVTSDKGVGVHVAGGSHARIQSPYMAPITPKKPGPKRGAGKRGKGGGGLYPVLAALGFVSHVSPWVASEVARCSAQLGSFEETADTLKRRGLDLDPDTVRKIAARVADAGLADRESDESIDANFLAGKRVVICPDGGRIRCRLEKPGRRRDSGYHGYETPWQEPKVFAAYVIDDKGNKLPSERPIYEGTMAPWKEAVAIAANTLRRFGIDKAALVVIAADGSENIWREIDSLIALAGIDRDKIVFFLDFYHATEHLLDAAKLSSRFKSDVQREQWARKQSKRLKKGKVERVLLDLEALPAKRGAAKDLRKECAYFRSRLHLMRYDQLRKRGLPIGTGAVESAIRRIVNLRLKGPGVFWKPENAERMLYLRARAKAGRWDEVEAALHRSALLPARDTRPEIFDRIAA